MAAVQSVVITHFEKGMHKGDSLDLFAAWIGVTFVEPGKREHVFLVNEFEKTEKRNQEMQQGLYEPATELTLEGEPLRATFGGFWCANGRC